MCMRIWDMMNQEQKHFATYDILRWYGSQWDFPCAQRTHAQVMLRSGMRIYALAEYTSHEVYLYYGHSKSSMVSVWEHRPLKEIIEPYVEGKHTLRPLYNMPKFIRDAVKEASQ